MDREIGLFLLLTRSSYPIMTSSNQKISVQTLTFSASHVAYIHTVFSSTAFATALILACALHYKKIIKNDVAGWPEEWWPSVSATWAWLFDLRPGSAGLTNIDRVGDWYPERNIFQILIALTSGLLGLRWRSVSLTNWIYLKVLELVSSSCNIFCLASQPCPDLS